MAEYGEWAQDGFVIETSDDGKQLIIEITVAEARNPVVVTVNENVVFEGETNE